MLRLAKFLHQQSASCCKVLFVVNKEQRVGLNRCPEKNLNIPWLPTEGRDSGCFLHNKKYPLDFLSVYFSFPSHLRLFFMNFKVFCHRQLTAFLSPWMGLWCKDRLRDDSHLFIATFVHQFHSKQDRQFQVHLAKPERSSIVYDADLKRSYLQEMPVFGLFIKLGQSRWHKGFYWKTPEYPQVTDKINLSWAVTVFSGGFCPYWKCHAVDLGLATPDR